MSTKPTQRDRVLAALKNNRAVCGTDLLRSFIPRYAAVIHKLRKDGYLIETRPCSHQDHSHDTQQIEYVLRAVPDSDPAAVTLESLGLGNPAPLEPTESTEYALPLDYGAATFAIIGVLAGISLGLGAIWALAHTAGLATVELFDIAWEVLEAIR